MNTPSHQWVPTLLSPDLEFNPRLVTTVTEVSGEWAQSLWIGKSGGDRHLWEQPEMC